MANNALSKLMLIITSGFYLFAIFSILSSDFYYTKDIFGAIQWTGILLFFFILGIGYHMSVVDDKSKIRQQRLNDLLKSTKITQNLANKIKGLLLILVIAIYFGKYNIVKAQDAGMRYTITSTSPSNGSTNIPQNLQSGETGSICTKTNEETICAIRVGLGIDYNNSVKGVGYPKIDTGTINSSTIQISSPSDSGISVKWGGSADGSAADFKIYVISSTNPNGTILMPSATYTITLRGGSNGLKAKYEGTQVYSAYLQNDYTWSFTTASGVVPARLPIQIASPNSNQTTPNSGGGSMEEKEAIIAKLLQDKKQQELNMKSPSPSPVPSKTPIIKKATPSPIPSATPEQESPSILPTPADPKNIAPSNPANFISRIRNYFTQLFNKITLIWK